jgi:diguanylate cyclase (GGDEF)-like protein
MVVRAQGLTPEEVASLARMPLHAGLGGRAMALDRVCTQQAYAAWPGALVALAGRPLRVAMAAPVRLDGRPVGSIMVGTEREGRTYEPAEQAAIEAFAEHVSLALNDARAVAAVNEALDHALHQAMHDALTGLPNRACFYDRTGQALRLGRRDSTSTAVLLFDLDRFKEVNDTLGHRYGDSLLCQIGGRIRPLLREADTLARLGGDEFCVLLPEVEGEEAAYEVATRITATLEEPFEIEGINVAVEASCGIAVAPIHGDTADILLQRSDVAMYVAKRTHVDVVAYADDLDAHTPDRLALLGELRQAIADEQLVLHYQPQASLSTGAVQGVEALVRWEHPRLGHLLPGSFIPAAEESGLIRPLTSWVRETALDQLREWMDDDSIELPDDFVMAVNLSARSFLDEAFHEEVTRALLRREIPAHRLVLEVTETTIMADPERAQRMLTDLAVLGIQFAIDDFGTGYSSLAALKSLPVQNLKIDQSFVSDMEVSSSDATIVRSVIDLGHTLGLHTIAEGVEGADVWERLRELGCDSGQGHVLARPMPGPDLLVWLRSMLEPQASLTP